ncbi:MAG: flagellar biosynthesis protein FlhB [Alphaproteobacteria bacterium]|nr:flagellar biosynthesis protein FlhB [Alphaproteobacteria bacterium]
MAEGGDNEQDDSQKTEEPSAKKLEESRKKGNVALSREINNWVMLLMATILIGTASGPVMSQISEAMKVFLEQAHALPGVPGGLKIIMGDTFTRVLTIIAPIFIMLVIAAVMGPLLQVGPLFAPEVIKPDFSKVSIFKGFKRLFSMRSIVEFLKSLLKICVIGMVGFFLILPFTKSMEHMISLDMKHLLDETEGMALRLMTGVLVVLLFIAILDYLYQRFEYMKKMRMTREEVKEEYKQAEGDPHIKGKLRQLRMERARQRMMQNVPKATVVITNPTHFAVALKYDSEKMEAPVVLAKGMDFLALKIREIATEHKIIIYENPPLARTLYDTVEVDEAIPQSLFKAVAEVITYVYQKQGKLKPK